MSVWTTKLRGPALGLTLGTALIIAAPLQAAEKQKSSKPENIGVLSGLVIGAVAGGPVGAIVGAAGGALVGERFHRKDVKNAELSASLTKSEAEKRQLMADLGQAMSHGEELGQKLNEALDKTVSQTRDLEAAFAFRTNDSSLAPDDVARLAKIGSLAGAIPKLKVRVSGFTDPRGSEEYNAALSQRRAASVAEVLSNAGLPVDRIVIEAHGEQDSTSTAGDLEGYAFERRVTVRIEDEKEGAAVALR